MNTFDSQFEELPASVLIQLNQACNLLEDKWQQGEAPVVEVLLKDVDPAYHQAWLQELLPLEIEYRRRDNMDVSVREYQDRFPNLAPDWLGKLVAGASGTILKLQPTSDDRSPQAEKIGNYQLLEPIGEGGFGIVYLAEQQHPVRRHVAVKVIKPGMDSKQVISRFEMERQALALMDHPNIAKILDAGTTDAGRPFFVMELVKGIPITHYCDQCKMPIRERLELFGRVCQAIQHAHQKGVIHRDIKPSNVLVAVPNGQPVPKIIDFGVAKAINQRLSEYTFRTDLAQMLGTPLYMSPEQAEMSVLDVDTRSDIYSLGVLLYELLTGTTPIKKSQLDSADFDELRRLIREDAPPRPSSRLSTMGEGATTIAESRRSDPQKTARLLRGDLDWIVMKAMEKDRTRRYVSADALAEDVNRHLENRPVEAGPPTLRYLLAKFSKRNRTGLVVGALTLSTLIVASLVSIWLAAKATRAGTDAIVARQQSEAVTDFLIEAFRSPDPRQDGLTVTVAQVLDRAVLDLRGEFRDEPLTHANMLQAVGETYLGLGLPSKAASTLEQVQAIRQKHLGPSHSSTAETERLLAKAYAAGGRTKDAIHIAEQVLQSQGAVQEENEETIDWMNRLSNRYAIAGRTDEAIELATQVFELRRDQHGLDHPDTLAALTGLAAALYSAGMFEDAKPLVEQSARLRREKLSADHPDTLKSEFLRAQVYWMLTMQNQAIQIHKQTLDRRQTRLGNEHPATVASVNALALAHREMRQQDEAIALYKEALQSLPRQSGSTTGYL